MKARKQVNISVDNATYEEFCKVAAAEHMEGSRFAGLLISKFSDLKQGHGLSALTSIPAEHFKLRPGRQASPAG